MTVAMAADATAVSLDVPEEFPKPDILETVEASSAISTPSLGLSQTGKATVNPQIAALVQVFTHFAASLEPTSPEVLRGIRASRVLWYAPRFWLMGRLSRLHSSSEAVTQLDEFWSHSWRLSAWTKFLNILFLTNGNAAFVAGTAGASLGYILFVTGNLPNWQDGSWWRCNWCVALGMTAYYLTMLFWCRRRLVFLDVACINQHDPQLKTEGLVSLGATLKISKSMLVLWDPTFVTRLWCVFELSAFLHSRPEGQRAKLSICPPFFGPLVLGGHLSLCAMCVSYLLLQDFLDFRLILGAASIPSATTLTHALRAYWRSIDHMEEQALNFSFDKASSKCCEQAGHPNPICDRAIISRCISLWFGPMQAFEAKVRSDMRMALGNHLANKAFPYTRLVQLSSPVMWLLMDRSANQATYEASEEPLIYQLTSLTRAFTYVLTVLPCITKLGLRVSYEFRCRRCTCCLDILLSFGLVLFGVIFFGMVSIADESFIFRLAPTLFPNEPAAPLYASCCLMSILSIVTILVWWYVPTSPRLRSSRT